MVGDAADIAAQLLRLFLSDELGGPFVPLLCTLLGEQADGCGSVVSLRAGQLKQSGRAGDLDGVVEAAVVALASWGMVAASVLVALLVYCICAQCCTQQAAARREYPPGFPGRSAQRGGDEPAARPASPAALAMVDTFSATKADFEMPSRGRTDRSAAGSEGDRQRDREAEASEELAPTTCAVCVEQIYAGQRVSRLACAHVFHARCLLTWLQRADSCPNCRLRLEEGYEHSHHG